MHIKYMYMIYMHTCMKIAHRRRICIYIYIVDREVDLGDI